MVARTAGRWLLATFLAVAGTGHLVATESFLAQVPPFLPFPVAIVIVSGLVELALAGALTALPRQRRVVGWLVAAWFVMVVPGNVSQAVTGQAAFGLDSDTARWGRLAFQPLLVVWALWATDALGTTDARASRRHARRRPPRRSRRPPRPASPS